MVDTYLAGKVCYRYYIKDVALLRSHSFTIIEWLFFSAVIALPPMPSHDTAPQKKTYTDLNNPVSQYIEVVDVVPQQMSRTEHCRSDLRQFSTCDGLDQARKEDSKMTPIVPESPRTSQTNCRAEQKHAMNTARENAIAFLIVLANFVPVCVFLNLETIIANNTRR